MDKLKRPLVWIPIAVTVFVLVLAAGAGGAYFALKPSAKKEGFITQGSVSSSIRGPNGFSSKARQCIVETEWGTLKEGTPVTISRDGRVVGTGELKAGQYEAHLPAYGRCEWDIAVPVSETVEGEYRVRIRDEDWGEDLEQLRDTGFTVDVYADPDLQ